MNKTDGMQYAEDVLSGSINAGTLIKLACHRFLDDLNREDLVFNEERANHVKKFIGLFHHYTGKFDKKQFTLLPWQHLFIENLYGFYWLDGRRRFNSAYLQLARKGGKTQLSAALCLYHLIADGEPDANVFLAAGSKEQAKIAYKACRILATQLDPKEKLYRCFRDEITFNKIPNKLKVLASDSTKLDGYNPSAYLIDEYHGHANSLVRDVLKSGTGMRISPMEIIITTAGFNKLLPCYTLRNTCADVLHNLTIDDTLFAMIFELDEEDDWQDEKNFVKCQPNLDITISREYMRARVQSAKNTPSDETEIRTKIFNMWCDAANIWIPSSYILSNSKRLDINDFAGLPCYIGVDLASTQDLTVSIFTFIKDGHIYSIPKFYIPEESLKTRIDKEIYKQWKRDGYLNVTPGNVTDYEYITKDIMDASKIVKIRKIAYDDWNATQWATDCTKLRLPLEPFSQMLGNFNGPTRELERLLMTNKITIDNNPILRWNFSNVTIRMDCNGNVKPDKAKSANKIDGVIALIQSIAILIEDSRRVKSKITM